MIRGCGWAQKPKGRRPTTSWDRAGAVLGLADRAGLAGEAVGFRTGRRGTGGAGAVRLRTTGSSVPSTLWLASRTLLRPAPFADGSDWGVSAMPWCRMAGQPTAHGRTASLDSKQVK